MEKYTQNSFLSYLLILAGFFILLFFTKGIYTNLQIELDNKEQNTSLLSEKQEELSRLNNLKNSLSQEWNELLEEIQWFSGDFSDKAIIDYIYSYAQQVNLWKERIIIRDISITWDKSTDLWFKKAQISLGAIVSSEKTLFAFLNYLTNQDKTYRFYVENFNYPLNETISNIQVTIPLTLYYR